MKCKLVTLILLNSLFIIANAANIAYVPKTAPGNTDTAGVGREWPTPRFVVDTTEECVIDILTGLMWARNANLLGTGSWGTSSENGTAQNLVAQMNVNPDATGYQLCGYSDWRLPNQNELLSLFNYSVTNGNQVDWLNSTGIFSVQGGNYWSSTPHSGQVGAWIVYMDTGSSLWYSDLSSSYSVWPVRGGK